MGKPAAVKRGPRSEEMSCKRTWNDKIERQERVDDGQVCFFFSL